MLWTLPPRYYNTTSTSAHSSLQSQVKGWLLQPEVIERTPDHPIDTSFSPTATFKWKSVATVQYSIRYGTSMLLHIGKLEDETATLVEVYSFIRSPLTLLNFRPALGMSWWGMP